MKLTTPLSDLIVVEWGTRVALRACGSLLAELGARVFACEAEAGSADAFCRFKTLLSNDLQTKRDALARANIVLVSSDRSSELPLPALPSDVIICDVTVTGNPEHGDWDDPLIQAVSGIADITGVSGGPPAICSVPIIELQTAIFAAAGILAAWRHRATTGEGQTVALSLVDCGLNNLSSFLPLVFSGKAPRRSGNRHPMAAPWNSYRAKDGWVLLCSATDEHWVRLCRLMHREALSRGKFEKLPDRIAHCDEVDAAVEAWTRTLSVKDCVAALGEAGLAAGPILTLGQLKEDQNLIYRGTLSAGPGPLPLSFLKTSFDRYHAPPAMRFPALREPRTAPPLTGSLVVEIGQYTTAPLAAKQLALLGAEVVKIEPPGGEASRAWPPHQDGQGYFFTMNNANKRSCVLDLRDGTDRESFAKLIERADVLIENLKPGSLARLGYDYEKLHAINPRLVYCAISGFGHDSAYPGRPAFDTVIQAMSGLMDVTRSDDIPVKLGISAADITGGIAGLLGVLAALEERRKTGRGMMVDLAMQDVAVWVTQSAWNGAPAPSFSVWKCADGYVVADRSREQLAEFVATNPEGSKANLIRKLKAVGVSAAMVRTLEEIAGDSSVVGKGAVALFEGADGRSWPLFRSPYRFSRFPEVPLAPIGQLGEANRDLLGKLT